MPDLKSELIAMIKAQGPLSIAAFFTECLLHPKFGYYTTRDPFGARGDFTTAPEISQMYGEMLGLFLAQTWRDQGSVAAFNLVELGPGRGTLMADILRARAAFIFLSLYTAAALPPTLLPLPTILILLT